MTSLSNLLGKLVSVETIPGCMVTDRHMAVQLNVGIFSGIENGMLKIETPYAGVNLLYVFPLANVVAIRQEPEISQLDPEAVAAAREYAQSLEDKAVQDIRQKLSATMTLDMAKKILAEHGNIKT